METLQHVRTVLIILEVLSVGALLFGIGVLVYCAIDVWKRRKL